jgi:hypothetical protein
MAKRKRRFIRLEARRSLSVAELCSAYDNGERSFRNVNLDGANLSELDLRAASFYGASLRGVNFRGADLTYVQFKSADLTNAILDSTRIGCTDLIGATFVEASFRNADFTGACLAAADCRGADFSLAWLNNTDISRSNFREAVFSNTRLSSVKFCDLDVGPFCNEKTLQHHGLSTFDSRAVIKSQYHPALKQFMLDCGEPEIFATYMIDCAKAIEAPLLRILMQSTFISYGGPDEKFARKVYDRLRAHKVITFFFPESATVGERIDNEVFRRIEEHDRVLLVCSRYSLQRPGVLHEIQETLDREARDGGATYLLPIMIDDYVLTEWKKTNRDLAERISRRIIGDFRGTARSKHKFDTAMDRVIAALRKKPAS